MLTLDKIYHASYVLKDVIRHTHIVKAEGISDDCEVYLKPENLQITGSRTCRSQVRLRSEARAIRYPSSPATKSAGELSPVPRATTLRALRLPQQSTE